VRLWRRAKLLRGLRLNLSKSGLSLTLGGKYAKVTYGKRGTTETLSLPATGLRVTRHEPPAEPGAVARHLAGRYGRLGTAGRAAPPTFERTDDRRRDVPGTGG
jgi:hypothetical protein